MLLSCLKYGLTPILLSVSAPCDHVPSPNTPTCKQAVAPPPNDPPQPEVFRSGQVVRRRSPSGSVNGGHLLAPKSRPRHVQVQLAHPYPVFLFAEKQVQSKRQMQMGYGACRETTTV